MEDFNVALQSIFVKNPDREILLKVVGNLKEDNVKTTGDDGVSQAVYYRTGAIENPGEFIDTTQQANAVIVEKGTYHLVFNSVTGTMTIEKTA